MRLDRRFAALRQQVQTAEQTVQQQQAQARQQWHQLQATWRAGWTPGRIVLAGLVTGFVCARMQLPTMRIVAGWLRLLRSGMPLLEQLRAMTDTAPPHDHGA
jgi:hypothetical protein